MIHVVVIFSLVLSGANWVLFVATAVVNRFALIRLALGRPTPGLAADHEEAMHSPRAQPDKLVEATGVLATSLRTAGPEASAAAMSLACLVIAAIAAGVDKL